MADDYDGDGDWLDMMDDAWLYVDDEFDLADELAEGQVPEPGYAGTSHELALEDYEFDLYAYNEDLEYGDDSYWEYERRREHVETAGQKRKRGAVKGDLTDKRQRTYNRDAEPILFRSREERNALFKQDAPLLKARVSFAFLADWRERFAGVDGVVVREMPPDMKRAAEAQLLDTPEKQGQFEEGDEEEEGDWEDDDDEGEGDAEDDDEDGDGNLAIDPDMLKQILKQKLGEAGLDGMDEEGFMDTLKAMLAGQSDGDDAAGMLANSLLGKVTSDTGDEALSGWLSQQGVSLEQDDDASSVATADQQDLAPKRAPYLKRTTSDNPPDSTVSGPNGIKTHGKSQEMPLHGASPTSANKKRRAAAIDVESTPRKKSKKVTFDVPSSSEHQPALEAEPNTTTAEEESPTSDDPLTSEPNVTPKSKSAHRPAVRANKKVTPDVDDETLPNGGDTQPGSTKKSATRKRGATSTTEDLEQENRPVQEKKKQKQTKKTTTTRNRELQDLESLPSSTPSLGPPSRRTRNARANAKGEK